MFACILKVYKWDFSSFEPTTPSYMKLLLSGTFTKWDTFSFFLKVPLMWSILYVFCYAVIHVVGVICQLSSYLILRPFPERFCRLNKVIKLTWLTTCVTVWAEKLYIKSKLQRSYKIKNSGGKKLKHIKSIKDIPVR